MWVKNDLGTVWGLEGCMKVLIAEDNKVSRHVLEATVRKWKYEVVSAHDGDQALEILEQDDAPRLVILDWMMPGLSGIEVCRKVRKKENQPYTYVILLTSRSQKEDFIEGMNAGADDYVSKPFDQKELNVRLRAGRRIVELQDELLKAKESLQVQATHDSLTGLKNRGMIFELLSTEVARCERESTPCGIVILDLDRFKMVNDTYGHACGDTVLREVALRMRESVRPYDSVGRYGGEEFLVLFPGCDAENTKNQAERLRRAILKAPIQHGDVSLSITASFGATNWVPGQKPDALVQLADEALYKAKKAGRNMVEYMDAKDLVKAAS